MLVKEETSLVQAPEVLVPRLRGLGAPPAGTVVRAVAPPQAHLWLGHSNYIL